MVGYCADAALSGRTVRQDGKVGGGEIVLYLGILDVMGEQLDPVLRRRGGDYLFVFNE